MQEEIRSLGRGERGVGSQQSGTWLGLGFALPPASVWASGVRLSLFPLVWKEDEPQRGKAPALCLGTWELLTRAWIWLLGHIVTLVLGSYFPGELVE